MKKRSLNLLIVSLTYAVAFIAIVAVLWGILGASLTDEDGYTDPNTVIFLATVFFAFLASFAVYLVYTLLEWKKADTEHNLKFLGVGVRILTALVATAISGMVFYICVNFWYSDTGDSLLQGDLTMAAVVLAVVTVINFVGCLKFKPRP